ncbi:MFS transporter [Neorhizobium sp. Rsf11]|uniref:MFS transporter n=2 Tax=Neorhizobium TaxID=1525371 RepID=A0ABV0MEF6_9HYPH|nr:MFS transporter [Neorhizobium petrolearium]MCC2613937.1 MFS transporter [Neorhizobium petrolearium]WGI71461.1 MFS transporter [Neorhizobium petrolearium]
MQADTFRRFGIFGGGLFFAITGMAAPFFTLYASEMGASTLAIGLIVTSRALLPIIIAMPTGQLIDSIGSVKMLQIGSALLLISLLNTVFATSVLMLTVSQLFMGACIIIMATALQVLVSTGDRETRNKAITTYSMWMSGGSMLGPLLGGLITFAFEAPADGYRFTFVAAAAATTVFMLLLACLSRIYPHPVPAVGEIRSILSFRGVTTSYRQGMDLTSHRPVQFGLVGTFVIMYIQALYSGFLPVYLDQFGYSAFHIAAILSWQGMAGMLSRFVIKALMRRFSLERILSVAGLLAAICVVLTPLAAPNAVVTYLLIFTLGAAAGVNLPVSMMIMVDAVGESQHGKLMGLRLLVNRFSQTISPALFGLLGSFVGLTAAFLAGGAVLVATMFGFSAYASHMVRTSVANAASNPSPKED